ncbi:unnamed protein product, partial [Discosporangium mesarthrocarpum]
MDSALFSVSHAFHPTAIDVFGDVAFSNSVRRCQPDTGDSDGNDLFDLHLKVASLFSVAYAGVRFLPTCQENIEADMEGLGFWMNLLEAKVDLETPWGLAKATVDKIYDFLLENDGWNADGRLDRDFNLIPFSDLNAEDAEGNSWEPYTPCNSPWKLKRKHRWQPLVETDGVGYISHQQHVTPYIGATARLFGFESKKKEQEFISRRSPYPNYKYHSASKEVLQEAAMMATDDEKKVGIEFFDHKFTSLIPLKIEWAKSRQTELEYYQVTLAVQLAMYDATVLVWREKVCHDRVRPPTMIKSRFGDEEVYSYAGPGEGAKMIKASEWQPYVRTMPHSEYPSASSCFCQVFAEVLQHSSGEDDISPPLQFTAATKGSLRSEPGITPATDVVFTYKKWSEIAEMCGQSRLWGGMHFEESVPAGAELCGGGLVASEVLAAVDKLVAGNPDGAVFRKDEVDFFVRPDVC